MLRPLRIDDEAQARSVVAQLLGQLERRVQIDPRIMSKPAIQRAARRIGKAISRLEYELESGSTPATLGWILFVPQPWPFEAEELEREVTKRSAPFFEELRRVRAICEEQSQNPDGFSSLFDHSQRHCALCAHGLMSDLSKVRIVSTDDGTFRTLASLLYKHVSKIPNADLKRHCLEVLRLQGTVRA
jgi:hypothetical protein